MHVAGYHRVRASVVQFRVGDLKAVLRPVADTFEVGRVAVVVGLRTVEFISG